MTSRPPSRARSLPALVAAGAALATAPFVSVTSTAAAPGAANLVVKSASVDGSKAVEGAVLRITHAVRNSGSAKAGASETRFYLSTDVSASRAARKVSRTDPRSAPLDIRLSGAAPVRSLAAGRSVNVQTSTVTVPVGTAAGSYTVLACVDDRGKVGEKNEADNCAVAAKGLKVQSAKGSDTLVLQTFADSYPWPANEDFNLQMMKVFCDVTTPPRAMTLKAALQSAAAFLDSRTGTDALERVEKSGQADTSKEAQELAAAGIAEGAPGLALAALMHAHGLEPGNGTHLVNLAAVANGVGLPNEALAFLDASQGRSFNRPAMGVSQHAVSLVLRGQALVMTGRPGPAELMFKAAKAAQPMLSEADAGLATIAACEDDDELIAARYVRKSRQRSQEKDEAAPDDEVERPAPQIDLGFGRVTRMRNFPIAETPAQGVVMRPIYWDIRQEISDETSAYHAEKGQLERHLRETDELRTQAEIDRRESLLFLVATAGGDPDLEAMEDDLFDQFDRLTLLEGRFFGGGHSPDGESTYGDLSDAAHAACTGADDYSLCVDQEMNATCRPALTAAHTQWRALMSEYETMLREYVAVASKRMSGYASNLEDEEAHRLALLEIESMESLYYSALLSPALGWTHFEVLYEGDCVAPLEAPVLETEDPDSAQSAGPCPPGIAAMNLVATLGPTKMKVTCEKVTQEISAETLPLLHAFAEVSYDFRTGKMTFFAGSKGEGKLGVVEGGFKSGIYVTSDGRGSIEDVGWRVGPSASVAEGAAEFQVVEDMVDLSFVSALKTGP